MIDRAIEWLRLQSDYGAGNGIPDEIIARLEAADAAITQMRTHGCRFNSIADCEPCQHSIAAYDATRAKHGKGE